MTSSLANHRCTLSDVFFYNILIFDVPQYSHIFHYIKDIRPAIYFDNQKSLHIILKADFKRKFLSTVEIGPKNGGFGGIRQCKC